MDKLVSLIVPVYNVESYLEECVDSLIHQTYRNIEIVLIDDGCTDNSGKICDQYRKRDKRISVIHKEYGGVSDARNIGLSTATGDYIMFVDSDDFVAYNYVELMLTAIVSRQADLVCCGFSLTNEAGEITASVCNKVQAVISKEESLRLLIQDNNPIENYVWNKIYKRCLFDKEKFPVGRLYEDVATMYKIFIKCNTIVLISDKLYYYRLRTGSIVHKVSMKSIEDSVRAQAERYQKLSHTYPQLEYELIDSFLNSLCRTYGLLLRLNTGAEIKEFREYIVLVKKRWNVFRSRLSLKKKLRVLCICRIPLIADWIITRHQSG